MAFADPQSVTVGGSAVSMPRVSSDTNAGRFAAADGSLDFEVSHQYGKCVVNRLRLHQSKIVADPLQPTINLPLDHSITVIYNGPKSGIPLADKKALVDALVAYLGASSGARVSQLLGGEN
jgi:hypothetical protein